MKTGKKIFFKNVSCLGGPISKKEEFQNEGTKKIEGRNYQINHQAVFSRTE